MKDAIPDDGISPYKVDWVFNGWLFLILVAAFGILLTSRALLLLVVGVASVAILLFDRTATSWGETAGIVALLPLGLGSILWYLSSRAEFRSRHFSAFRICVNLAFYASIGMMLFTPADRTFRGWCGKIATFWLFSWIVQQGYYKGWDTMQRHDKMLVFTAINKTWIFSHAVYRYILLTLPVFGAGHRHRLLDVFSLALTLVIAQLSGLPYAHCFGMADTLVVPIAAGWSSLATTFEILPPADKTHRFDIERDLFLAGLQLSVALIAAANMFDAYVERSVELEKLEKAKNPKPPPPPKADVTSYQMYEV